MSKSKAELSISARLLLDYIVFRRKLNYTFFEKNETIGFKLDLTEGTIKELVNRLVRMGYLVKGKDKYGRRVLETTALKHKPLFYPLQEINKRGLKEELEHQTKELEKAEQLAQDYLNTIEVWRNRCIAERQKVIALEQQVAELQWQLNALPATPTPQTDNTTTIEEEYTDNSESVVNVGSMDNVGNEGNTSNITDDNVVPTDNPNTMDARVIVDNLMRKLCPEKYEPTN